MKKKKTNKVENEKKIRGKIWGTEETNCLILLWGSPGVQKSLYRSFSTRPIIQNLVV